MTTISPQQARGSFLARAAEALLRTLGGCEVRLLLPVPATADATAQQLGLVAGTVEETTFAPVVVRTVSRLNGEQQEFELLFPAPIINRFVDAQPGTTAEALFASARGVMVGERRLRVMATTTEYFAGSPYLYRVLARE